MHRPAGKSRRRRTGSDNGDRIAIHKLAGKGGGFAGAALVIEDSQLDSGLKRIQVGLFGRQLGRLRDPAAGWRAEPGQGDGDPNNDRLRVSASAAEMDCGQTCDHGNGHAT